MRKAGRDGQFIARMTDHKLLTTEDLSSSVYALGKGGEVLEIMYKTGSRLKLSKDRSLIDQ